MIQFLIVAVAVFLVTAHFWDVETAIKTGPKLLDYWMLAGLAIIILSPIFAIVKFICFLLSRCASLLRRALTRKSIT